MVELEGNKYFMGIMRIVPKGGVIPPFELEGAFLYRADTDCWYDGISSYPASICEIVKDNGSLEGKEI